MCLLKYGIIIFIMLTSTTGIFFLKDCETGSICKPINQCNSQNSQQLYDEYSFDRIKDTICGFSEVPMVCCSNTINSIPSPLVESPRQLENPIASGVVVNNHVNLNLINRQTCGSIISNTSPGGTKTSLTEYPWMALLQYDTNVGIKFACSGTLINNRYVLTVAHCITNLPIDYRLISVRLGEHNPKTENDCEMFDDEMICMPAVQDIEIEETIPHENYNKPRFANDIGLIRLTKLVDLTSEFVRPICLPTTELAQETNLNKPTVVYWGTNKDTEQWPDELLQHIVWIITNEQCQSNNSRVHITDGQICSIDYIDDVICKGHAGVPIVQMGLISQLLPAKFIQFGIASAGSATCSSKASSMPDIYTNVSFYMKWILDNIRS